MKKMAKYLIYAINNHLKINQNFNFFTNKYIILESKKFEKKIFTFKIMNVIL